LRFAPARTLPSRLAPLLLAVLFAAGAGVRAAHADEPDYSGWQALLSKYTRVVHEKGKPWDSRFDYGQLFIDEGIWKTHQSAALSALHTQLLAASPADMTPAERTAWAINVYNFLVIERMTMNLLVPGHKFQRFDSPHQLHGDDGSFFGARIVMVDGTKYSLVGLERRFVYGDTSADPGADESPARDKPGDPRLMFAVCKASYGTGPLMPWVWRSDSLEAQLNLATRRALALPRYVQANEATGELVATNRFFEERADFGGPDLPGLVPFLKKYGTPATQRLIAARKLTKASRFFEPDWKLNYFEPPKAKLPGAADSTATKTATKSAPGSKTP